MLQAKLLHKEGKRLLRSTPEARLAVNALLPVGNGPKGRRSLIRGHGVDFAWSVRNPEAQAPVVVLNFLAVPDKGAGAIGGAQAAADAAQAAADSAAKAKAGFSGARGSADQVMAPSTSKRQQQHQQEEAPQVWNSMGQ